MSKKNSNFSIKLPNGKYSSIYASIAAVAALSLVIEIVVILDTENIFAITMCVLKTAIIAFIFWKLFKEWFNNSSLNTSYHGNTIISPVQGTVSSLSVSDDNIVLALRKKYTDIASCVFPLKGKVEQSITDGQGFNEISFTIISESNPDVKVKINHKHCMLAKLLNESWLEDGMKINDFDSADPSKSIYAALINGMVIITVSSKYFSANVKAGDRCIIGQTELFSPKKQGKAS